MLVVVPSVYSMLFARRTGVGSAGSVTGGVIDTVLLLGTLGVEVALSLLGDGDGVLSFVGGRHFERMWLCCWLKGLFWYS